jgi:SHS2 domain-containing protein
MRSMQKPNRWEHFEHGADIGVRGYGDSLEKAFEQTGLALTAVVTDPDNVECEQTVSVQCEAPDDELLLADWLNAIIYEMAIRNMLFSRFQVSIKNHVLQAILCGEIVNTQRHKPAVEIKGATYTALQVACNQQGNWRVQCVVDV